MKINSRILRSITRAALILIVITSNLSAYQSTAPKTAITPDVRAALDRISAERLRRHLSFIASDELGGRNTPSRGLDMAAEYIAAEFRRAGLEPVGDDGYFQTAPWLFAERNLDSFKLQIGSQGETLSVDKNHVSLTGEAAITIKNLRVFKVDYKDAAAIAALTADQVQGQIVVTEIPDFRREDRSRRSELFRAQNDFLKKMQEVRAFLVISVDRLSTIGSGAGQGRLIDPENRRAAPQNQTSPLITVHDPKVIKLFDSMKPGPTGAVLSLEVAGATERPVKLRNVVGLLRGSDPKLRDTCVLVTAHYDHIGTAASGQEDRIFNGANDDGSGTVSVIELATTLAKLKMRPKRSILFMTFFGEEKGMLGSRYYARHPIFPIEKTVADINLEHVGRTDSSEGPQLSNATLTGFDFSDVGTLFKAAGEMVGVNVYKHESNSDAFFGRSDNQALADLGVPAHTLCVAFIFPDYHAVGDHWDKINYENMEKVNRLVALGLVLIADSAQEPRWNEANPKAARYLKAWKDRHSKPE
jgi:peptidase M28-like protein